MTSSRPTLHPILGTILIVLMAAWTTSTWAQSPSGGEPIAPDPSGPSPAGGQMAGGQVADGSGLSALPDPTGPQAPASTNLPSVEEVLAEFKAQAPPDVYEEGMKAVKRYEEAGEKLKERVAEMRKAHTLFVNGYNDDKRPYLELRDECRVLMNDAFLAANRVLGYIPHTDAAKYVVTVLEERFKHDVYDADTMEGAARLLEYGVPWTYVVLSAARSALVVGNFQLAENIYENVNPESLQDVDRRLLALKDAIKQQFETEQALLKNDPEDLPKVRILTSRGEVIADLFINEAPSTVAHFITLVESGFYDGLDFFQVIEGLLALTGDPLGDGSSRPDRYIADEHGREVVRMPLAGSLVMAKLPLPSNKKFVPNSAGTQFSILYLPLPPVIQEQTVFGRVTKGMDIIGALRRVDPHKEKKKNAVLVPPDRIISCEILNRPKELPQIKYVDPPPGL